MSRVDVAIVGYGPVGCTLANLLGQAGRSVVVIEPSLDVYPLPRAIHLDGDCLPLFESLGLADEVLACCHPLPGMDFVTAAGEKLFGFDGADRPVEGGYEADYMFHQPMLERALRAGVERFPTVDVRLGHEVVGLDLSEADGATLVARDVATDTTTTVTARYVVGCDGARSFVRKAVGIELDDRGFDQPWLVVDARLRPEATCVLSDRVLQICDPARPATYVPSVGTNRRWEFMSMGEPAEELLEPGTIARLLAPYATVGVDVDVDRAAVYSFHALTAIEWRRGCVLLAGDAAHQMPPFLGQGMCSGLRDVAWLAPRLAEVLDGADDAVLDGYQPAREAHVRGITDLAVKLGGILQTTDPGEAAHRDQRCRELGEAALAELLAST